MERAFGWIGEIFQNLMKVLPWLVIVPATHAGVAFARGRHIKKWAPGLHIYWPLVTTYKLAVTVRQTQMIQSKIVMTKDLKTVIAGALVTYFVDDIVAALAQIADLASDVLERSQGAILDEISKTSLEAIQSDRLGFNAVLTERCSATLNGYGVQVISVQLTEFAPCKVIAIKGNATVGNYSLWTGF